MEKENYTEIKHTFIDRFKGDAEVGVALRFKKPSAEGVERCQSKVSKKPTMAFRSLCVSCIHPDDKETMLGKFEEYPGLATSFGNALLEAAGFADLGN